MPLTYASSAPVGSPVELYERPRPTIGRHSLARAVLRVPAVGRVPAYLLAEARPPIVAVFTVRMVVSIDVVGRFSLAKVEVVVAWALLTIAVYVFNGITDFEGDRLNRSRRPLASGRLSRRTAGLACAGLALVGLSVCWAHGRELGVAATVSLLIGWAYSAGPALKRSAAACAATIFGGAAVTYLAGCVTAGQSAGVMATLAAVSVWIGAASVVKDFSDVAGDRAGGRRTIPVRLGVRRSGRVAAALAGGASVFLIAVTSWLDTGLAPVAGVVAAGTAALAGCLLRVRPAQTRRQLRRPYRVFLLTQLAANAAILLCLR